MYSVIENDGKLRTRELHVSLIYLKFAHVGD